MIQLELSVLQRDLPRFLDWVTDGVSILVSKDGQPIAEIRRPDVPPGTHIQPVGLAAGLVKVPPSFFEPLPDDLLDAFEGKTE